MGRTKIRFDCNISPVKKQGEEHAEIDEMAICFVDSEKLEIE